MWFEWNNNSPEDICGTDWVPYFFEWNLNIPEWIRFHISQIHSEASQAQIALKSKIIENYVRSSIDISSWDELLNGYVYNEIFSELVTWVSESRGTLEDIDFPDYALRGIFTSALEFYKLDNPDAFALYAQQNSHLVLFSWREIDISLLVSDITPQNNTIPDMPIEVEQDDVLSPEVVLQWFKERIYTRDQVIEILEWEEGFQEDKNNWYSLSNALDQFWFWDNLQADINTIFWRELTQHETKHLLDMVQYFLYVESSGWYNVSNYEWISTAKWYFQYLSWNWKNLREVNQDGTWVQWWDWTSQHIESDQVRKVWGTNSYETALSYIPEEITLDRVVFQSEIDKRWNQNIQDPRLLSSDEQIILFLSDLGERPWADSHIEDMFQGDTIAVEELYRLHHTNTDEATEFRMLLAGRDVYEIEIKTYQRTWDSVEGLILPWINMTHFFTQLIQEFNPNTSLSSLDIMKSLDRLWNITFQSWSRVNIKRSTQDGIAYILELNDESYLHVLDDGSFIDTSY